MLKSRSVFSSICSISCAILSLIHSYWVVIYAWDSLESQTV